MKDKAKIGQAVATVLANLTPEQVDVITSLSYDELNAFYDHLWVVNAERKGLTIGPYGGIRTDMNSLPVGTRFFVHNGHWRGSIIEFGGQKFALVDGGKISVRIPAEGYELDISVEEGGNSGS